MANIAENNTVDKMITKLAYNKYTDQKALENSMRRRLKADEQRELINYCAALDQLCKILRDGGLADRLKKHDRDEQKYKTAITYLNNILSDILNSVPRDGLDALKRQMANLVFLVDIKANIPKHKRKAFGRVFTYEQIDLIGGAIREQCALCTKTHEQQRKCEYAKLLDELPIDKVSENGSGCGWFEFWATDAET